MSAPSSSGRWPSGEAKVLSTTRIGRSPRAPRCACEPRGNGGDVDHAQVRVGRRLEPHDPGRVVQDAVESRLLVAGHGHVRRFDAHLAPHSLEIAECAAVDVVDAHDPLARSGKGGDGLGRCRSRRERQAEAGTLERRDRLLQPGTGRIAGAGVLPATARTADSILGECRGLVDGWRDGAGRRIGLGTGVHGERRPAASRARDRLLIFG